jgi:hypothetical protein
MPRKPENNPAPSGQTAPKAPRPAHPPDPGARFQNGVVDRRSGIDRRNLPRVGKGGAVEGPAQADIDRRRGPGRRLSDFAKSAEEGEMNREQFLFLTAIDAFKRANAKTFPTWTEVLEVIRLLGYRKTMPSELALGAQTEDWREPADAPSAVRTRTPKAA